MENKYSTKFGLVVVLLLFIVTNTIFVLKLGLSQFGFNFTTIALFIIDIVAVAFFVKGVISLRAKGIVVDLPQKEKSFIKKSKSKKESDDNSSKGIIILMLLIDVVWYMIYRSHHEVASWQNIVFFISVTFFVIWLLLDNDNKG